MTDALERIWARKHPVKHGHHWHDATSSAEVATDINGSPGTINHFVPYRRADLPPTLAEALTVPEVREMVEAVEALKLRDLVAGWNGEGRDTPYAPHPPHLWAKITTTCGVVYAIDAALAKLPKGGGE